MHAAQDAAKRDLQANTLRQYENSFQMMFLTVFGGKTSLCHESAKVCTPNRCKISTSRKRIIYSLRYETAFSPSAFRLNLSIRDRFPSFWPFLTAFRNNAKRTVFPGP